MIGPSPYHVEEVERQGKPPAFYLRRLSTRTLRIGSRKLAEHMAERFSYGWTRTVESTVIPGQIDLDGKIAA